MSAHIGDEDIDKDTGNIRFDDRELTEFGGDLFNGLLHGNINQFLKADVAELMMGNPNIGNSNEEINKLGEIEVRLVEDANANNEEGLEKDFESHNKAIVNVGKDEHIEETENGPSDSPMDEEEMDVTGIVVGFLYAGKAGFRSKVSKKLVDIYGMGKIKESDGLKEGKRETIEGGLASQEEEKDGGFDRAEIGLGFRKEKKELFNLKEKAVPGKATIDNKSKVDAIHSTAPVEDKKSRRR